MNSHWFCFVYANSNLLSIEQYDKSKVSIYRESLRKDPIYLNPYSII